MCLSGRSKQRKKQKNNTVVEDCKPVTIKCDDNECWYDIRRRVMACSKEGVAPILRRNRTNPQDPLRATSVRPGLGN